MDRKQYAVASGRTRITAPPRGSKRMALAGHGEIDSIEGSFWGQDMRQKKTGVLVGWLVGWSSWLVGWLVVGSCCCLQNETHMAIEVCIIIL